MVRENDFPDKIYLQVGPNYDGEAFSKLEEVTWCKDRIYCTDIEYKKVSKPQSGR